MESVPNTVFVLGAGFSVQQGYPLARQVKERVIDFLRTERDSEYWGFVQAGNGGYREGQFFAGLQTIDPAGMLQFEELLLKLAMQRKQGEVGPWDITDHVLRVGAARLIWTTHNRIEEVAPAYRNFASWLGVDQGQHGVISFNWDLQVEMLLTQANMRWSYTLASGIPIIKPHGSVNWNGFLRDGLEADYPYWQAVSAGSKLSFDSKNPLSNPDPEGINRPLNYMIFPGDIDPPNADPDAELLWRDAARVIDKAETVVFIGYSVPNYDSDAREFLVEAVRGKKIVAINPSLGDLGKFAAVFGYGVELRQEAFSQCQYGRSGPST